MKYGELKIFRKQKGIYIALEYKFLFLGFFLITIMYFLKEYYRVNFNNCETAVLIFIQVYVISLVISNLFRYKREIGTYTGMLIFLKDRIKVGKKTYHLKDIKKLEFTKADDIKGMFVNSMSSFSPKISNGTDNECVVLLQNGDKIKCNFSQTKKQNLELFKDVLIHYYQKGIISWLHLLEVLRIEDYYKIQQLKNEITEFKK